MAEREGDEKEFIIKIDSTDAHNALDDLNLLLDEVGLKVEDTERQVLLTEEAAQRIMKGIEGKLQQVDEAVTQTKLNSFKTFTQITGAIRALISGFAGMLSPLQSALLSSLFAAVEILAAIATAQFSNPFTAGFAAITTAASIILSISGAAEVEQSMNEARQTTAQAENILNTAIGFVGSFL